MEWLNIHTKTLDSEAVIGADPIERGTWLMLLRYCIGQENGGIIIDALNWKDRKCQQLLRVTHKEITTPSPLWKWEGNDLHVTHYPLQKEEEVKTNRLNGTRGGRPKTKTQTKPSGFELVKESPNPNETTRPEIAETERNRKGKEKGIGKEGEATPEAGDATTTTDQSLIDPLDQNPHLIATPDGLLDPGAYLTASTDPTGVTQQAYHLWQLYAQARRSHMNETLREAKAAILRHGFTAILTGTQTIVDTVKRWSPAERMNFCKRPDLFFAGDHWNDDPTLWLSKAERTTLTHGQTDLDLGGRKPASITHLG